MYNVVPTQQAIQDFRSLSDDLQKRIATKLKYFSEEPLQFAKKLSNPKIGTFRFRIGDYRAIFVYFPLDVRI
jgi:mRNA interferase RelE/StbE